MKIIRLKIRKGSAIIVTLLVMAILLTLTLSLSLLTVSEMRQTGDAVAAGKAYYAAEAGIENALLDLEEHLPGYQTYGRADADAEGWILNEEPDFDGEKLSYSYRVRNQGDRYPYFDEDTPIFLSPGNSVPKDFLYADYPEATYDILPLNRTVTIPLFTACPDGVNYKDVTNFVLEYYVNFDTEATDWDIAGVTGTELQDFDVLRWKLFGEPVSPADPSRPFRTESISDFYPAREDDGPAGPVCIGSDIDLANADNCKFPAAKRVEIITDYPGDWEDFGSEDYIKEVLGEIWSEARECTTYDAGQNVAPGEVRQDGTSVNGIKTGCTIRSFLQHHRKNYLTLTNVVNPDIIGISDPAVRDSKANIFYRLVAAPDANETCESDNDPQINLLVRPYADISADGFASGGRVKQSIDARLRLNSFLPVFNFTLYRTDPGSVDPDAQSASGMPGSPGGFNILP